MADTYGVAIIGTGFGRIVHFPAFTLHPDFTPIVICGRKEEKTKRIAEELNVPYSVKWTEVVSREDIDVVAIATQPEFHYKIAKKAIESGKHVLAEKPLGISSKQAEELFELAEDYGVSCMVNLEFRYIPERAYLVELINNGYLGEIFNFNITVRNASRLNPRKKTYNWWSEKTQGGGVLYALGSLYIDMITQIFPNVNSVCGKPVTQIPKRLDRSTGKMREVNADDSFAAMFDLGSTIGHLLVSSVSPFGRGVRIEFYGSKGYLSILEDLKIRGAKVGIDDSPKVLELPSHLQLPDVANQPFLVKPFMKLLDEFSSALANGTSPNPNFADAAKLHKIIEAIYLSYEDQKVVKLS